jgi:hypothetical protein
MNVKSIFGIVGDTLAGIVGVLSALVSVGILSQIVFGTGWLGMDILGNIANFVNTFVNGGVTGLLVLVVVLSFWNGNK